MQIVINIIAVIFVIGLLLKWFSIALKDLAADRRINLLFVLFLAIIFKIAVAVIWYQCVGHNFDEVWQDTYYYDWGGKYLAEHFRNFTFYKPGFSNLFGSYSGGYYYIGFIYTLFGHHPLMVSIFNTLASVAIAIFMYQIAARIFDRKTAKWSFILNLFYPYYISISFYLLRDIIVTFLVVGVAWSLTKRKSGVSSYCFLILFMLTLYFFRTPLAVILLGLIALHLIIEHNIGRNKILKTAFVVGVSTILFIGFCGFFQPTGRTVFERFIDIRIGESEASPEYLEGARGAAGILSSVKSHPASFLKHGLQNTISIFWGPFHFCGRSGPTFFNRFGRFIFWENLRSIFMLFLMPMVAYGAYHCFRNKKRETFIFYSFIVVLVLVLVFMGNVIRWALPMMPFVMMFGAVGCTRFDSIKQLYVPYLLTINLLAVINATYPHNLVVTIPLLSLTFAGIILIGHRYRRFVLG